MCVVYPSVCSILWFVPILLSPLFPEMAIDFDLLGILVGFCMVMFVPIVVRVGLVGFIVMVLISLGLLPHMVLAPFFWPMHPVMPVLTFWVLVVVLGSSFSFG